MKVLAESGVDIIELGMPFTDPIADGPVIQKSVERALQNNTSLNDVFSTVNSFKKSNPDVPVVLMGYLNPIENLTYKKFSSLSKKNNVDGVLIVDFGIVHNVDELLFTEMVDPVQLIFNDNLSSFLDMLQLITLRNDILSRMTLATHLCFSIAFFIKFL